MKVGFRVEIDKGLSAEEYLIAKSTADDFIVLANRSKGYRTGGWGSASFYRRGIYGRPIWHNGKQTHLTIRRACKNKRIFIITKGTNLVQLDGSEINHSQCMCAEHLGGTRVKWRTTKPEVIIYYEIGDIQG